MSLLLVRAAALAPLMSLLIVRAAAPGPLMSLPVGQTKLNILLLVSNICLFKGLSHEKFSWVLLYLNRKLFSRANVAHCGRSESDKS